MAHPTSPAPSAPVFSELYERAQEFEQYLGDVCEATNALSWRRAVESDEREAYPQEACAAVDEWGLAQHYIPCEAGGAFRSFEELFALLRLLARRDVTVVVAHAKTYLGAIGVWLSGNTGQQQRLAQIIRDGGQVALALTERAHGSDLLATEVTATKVAGGYRLSGEKWLINNATRCAAMTLFARTDAAGGARGFSLFFIEKAQLDASRYRLLAKIPTHGVRGADISGIAFDDCFLADGALVGKPGQALETMLKGFQATRTLVPAISLGAADTALRSTLRFAVTRRLYQGTVFAIPEARRVLVESFVRLLIGECVALAAARSLHVAPAQMSLTSAVSKYFVPTQMEEALRELAVVLGARHFLREEHDAGIFQKLLRDNALAGLFDGSTVINLNVIAQQLQQLGQAARSAKAPAADEVLNELQRRFSLRQPLPDFDSSKLELTNRGRDDITQGLPLFHALPLSEFACLTTETRSDLRRLVAEILQEYQQQQEALQALPRHPGNSFQQAPELFELARRYCALYAAACCLWMWWWNREQLGEFFARGGWLVLALNRLLTELQPWRWEFFSAYDEGIGDELLRLQREERLFSLLPLPLARS